MFAKNSTLKTSTKNRAFFGMRHEKNSYVKRILSLLIICVTLVLSTVIVSSASKSTQDITNAMTALKNSSYPQNNYWCGGNVYSSMTYSGCKRAYGCTCNNFNNAYQCHGFALCVAKQTVGSFPAGSLSSYTHGLTSGSWKCYTKSAMGVQSFCALGLQPGDIVRASTSYNYSDGHTAIVWKVEGGKVYFAEAWGSVYCKINWGGFNYASYSLSAICSKYTYVALWRNSEVQLQTGCSHNYTTSHEAAHPHRIYKKCSLCGETSYTGAYQKVAGCVCCNGTHNYTSTYEATHPHYEVKSCNLCGNTVYTGLNNKDYSCEQCLGLPYDMKVSLSHTKASVGQSISVNYSAKNAKSYTLTIKCDSTQVTETVSLTQTSYTFTPKTVGNYNVTVQASTAEGKTNSVKSDIVTITAPISEVTESNGKYTLKYNIALNQTDATNFCNSRGLTLTEYYPDHFFAEFENPEPVYEQTEQTLYTYMPVGLSYYEIIDFCKLTNKAFVYSDSKIKNEFLTSLCKKAASPGILMGASDTNKESSWTTYDSNKTLGYKNWHSNYTGAEDRFRNYLFMYPNGTWIDSEAMPLYGHGFVTSEYNPFTYTENEDGTLTLTALPITSSDTLTIPSKHDNKVVTAIAANVFSGCAFNKVIIPDSITEISENAFDNSEISSFGIPMDWPLQEYFELRDHDFIYTMPFNDVKEVSWYYNSVYFCYINRYITGTSKTAFSPAMTCTREMFVTVLCRILDADTSLYEENSSFTDVPVGRWYSASIEWAYVNGITSGIGNSKFGLGDPITREQIAVLLSNMDPEAKPTADLTGFSDADAISEWAVDSIMWAISHKVLNGTSASTLEPKRIAMRTELCQMIYNYCQIFNSENK